MRSLSDAQPCGRSQTENAKWRCAFRPTWSQRSRARWPHCGNAIGRTPQKNFSSPSSHAMMTPRSCHRARLLSHQAGTQYPCRMRSGRDGIGQPSVTKTVTTVTKSVTKTVTAVTLPVTPPKVLPPSSSEDSSAAVHVTHGERALWRSAYDIWTTVAHDGKRCGDPATHRKAFESVVRDAEARQPADPLELISRVAARYVATRRKQEREPAPRFFAADFAALADKPTNGAGSGPGLVTALPPKQAEYRAAAAEWAAAQKSGDAARIKKAHDRAEAAGKAIVPDG